MKVRKVCTIISLILAGLFIILPLTRYTLAEKTVPYDMDLYPYGSVLNRTLSIGMTGADVAALQSMLYKLGYLTQDVTGCFDQTTKDAVIAFQKAHEGLSQDGIVNRDMVSVLNTVLTELENDQICFIYDAVIPIGSSVTINPVFLDDQEHSVTLYSNSPLISISGTTISGLQRGSTEVTAYCEGQTFKFFCCIRPEQEIIERADSYDNANNIRTGYSQRREQMAGYTGDTDTLVIFAGDCFLDERLFFTDFPEYRFKGNNIRSIALSGSTIKQWKTYIKSFYAYNPESLLMCIGINDLRHGYRAEEVIGDLISLLETIRENMPDTTVYWWKLMPHIGVPEQYFEIAAVNAALEAYFHDDSKLIVVDSNAALSDENGVADPSLFLDTLHPNSDGYDRLFEATMKAGMEFH